LPKQTDKKDYLFNKNIKKLNKVDLAWKAYLVDATKDLKLVGENNKNKQLVISYKVEDKEDICISGRDNPKKTAEVIIETEYNKRIKSHRFKGATTAIAFVLDPYLLEELLIKYHWVKNFFVVFPSTDYFVSLLFYYDFSKILKNKAFKPIFHNNSDDVSNLLGASLAGSSYLQSGLMMFSYAPYGMLFKDFYGKSKETIQKVTDLLQVNLNTNFMLGGLMNTNVVRHLDKLLKFPTVSILKDKAIGKPVICVSAGPSLAKNIEFLKKIQNEVFIIAITTTAYTLLKHGIRPDLMTIIDMQPLVLDQLKDIDVSGIPIVVEMSCHHSVVEEVNTDFIFSLSPVTSKTFLVSLIEALGMQLTTDDFVSSGLTVAITSLMCAARMGASQIILVGQDLAITSDVSHVDGTVDSYKTEVIEENGQKFFKNISHQNSEVSYTYAKEVDGYYGGKVYTTPSLDVFINYFRRLIKDNNLTNVYNATEGGAFIEGCEHISLKEVYKRFIKNNKLNKNDIKFDLKKKIIKKDIKQGKKNLQLVIDRMQTASNLAKEGLDLIEEFMKRTNKVKKEKFDELWLGVAVEKINKIADTLNTDYVYEVNAIAQLSETNFYLFHLINNTNNTHYSEAALQADMQNKFVLFFANVHEGLNVLVAELNGVTDRIDKEFLKKKVEA
jgi:hypothetical protein